MGIWNTGTRTGPVRSFLTTTTGYLLHLDVLGGLLGEVLLGAVVQDALHPEAPHSVDGRGDCPGVLGERERRRSIVLLMWRNISPRHPQTDRRTSASSEQRKASSPGSSSQSSSAGTDTLYMRDEAYKTYKFVVADEDLDSTKLEDHESSEDLPCCLWLERRSVVLQ